MKHANTTRSSILVAALLAALAGCTDQSGAAGAQARSAERIEAGPATPEEAGRVFLAKYEGRCEGPLVGRVTAPENALGIASYAYAIDREGERVTMVLEGEDGGRLGAWSTRQILDERGAPVPGSIELTVEGSGAASDEPIVVRTGFRAIGADAVRFRAETSRGEDAFGVHYDFDERGQVTSARLSRTVSPEVAGALELGASVASVGERVTVELELLADGQQLVEPEQLEAWLEQVQMPEWFDGPEMQRMGVVASDLTWTQVTLEHAQACQRGEALGAYTRAQAIGANESCTWTDLFDPGGGGAINIIVTSVGIGVGALIAGGFTLTVGSGAAIVALVAGILATAYWVYKKACTQNGCSSACVAAGAGSSGSCDGAFSCKCSDEPDTGAGGDPHIVSADRVYFDLQAVGEFVALEATAGEPFVLQVRQQRTNDNVRCPSVTWVSALATDVRGVPVRAYARLGDEWLRVGGEVVTLAVGQRLDLARGGYIERTQRRYVVQWPGGERMEVARRGSTLDAWIDLPDGRIGQLHGLWGTFDGDRSNDLLGRDGTLYGGITPVEYQELYEGFAASWQVKREESLFDYTLTGDTPDAFDDLIYPRSPNLLGGFEAADVDDAREQCTMRGVDPVLLDGCTLDVLCTTEGDPIDFFTDAPGDIETLDVVEPIFFTDWVDESAPGNGNWEVSDNERSVTQTVNGDPTFFVSPDDYQGVTLSGTWSIRASGDDDFIGFVFGYSSPLASNMDAPDAYDFMLFDWKRLAQPFGGFDAPEGFTLARVLGPYTDANSDALSTCWGHSDEITTVLGTRYGSGLGWAFGRDYRFLLSYSSERVRVFVDGALVFDVAAADTPLGSFPDGRFGFYNFSQSDVTYADFEALPYTLDVVFHDNFEQEACGSLTRDYGTFERWDVFTGTVDCLDTGGTSVSVDLDGSMGVPGGIRTKTPIALEPGRYRLSFELRDPSVGEEVVTVRLGDVYAEEFELGALPTRDLNTIVRVIEVDAQTTAPLSFETTSFDFEGAYLDNVVLARIEE